jgi:integrase
MRVAKATSEKAVPTPEQIRHVLQSMPTDTEIGMRKRAVLAFIFLTGARDGAVVSMKLRHVNLVEEKVVQDAREVRTKFSKSFTTWFFPVGDDVVEIVRDWVDYLVNVKLFGPSDPLFPATRVEVGADQRFQVTGLDRRHWSNATPIRQIFKEAFEAAGLPYFNPHSFRDTLVQLGERLCQTPEEFKGWSQNLGHEKVMTTFSSYGEVSSTRQGQLLKALRNPRSEAAELQVLAEKLSEFARRSAPTDGGSAGA